MAKQLIIAVAGPTASGKTALAVELALIYGGEIISADSMQVYKGMDIATAKPAEEEKKGVPHHLLNFLEKTEYFSAARFTELAKKIIDDIIGRDKTPIIAGGTGLYIDSLLQNTDFGNVPEDGKLRESLKKRMEEKGGEALLEELRAVDPEKAGILHPNNKNRIIRALEVFYLTGEALSEREKRSKLTPSPYNAVYIGLDYRDRQKLYEKIEKRTDRMIKNGLIEEARELLSSDPDSCFLIPDSSAHAIGYKELLPYFSREATLEEAASKLKRSTRNYAKRQLTWFRKNKDINWIYVDDCGDFECIVEKAKEIIGEKLC
ncbi:MAG: tRNA (adenosine(37)-N6)-dimethylallyltransferase MiaA [Oscillospiraceae bacterium]|nr:tRNA (adenosine(37)-N6)-dimethylallyltransferase MiaA [Oscillospiraceae bacterium]